MIQTVPPACSPRFCPALRDCRPAPAIMAALTAAPSGAAAILVPESNDFASAVAKALSSTGADATLDSSNATARQQARPAPHQLVNVLVVRPHRCPVFANKLKNRYPSRYCLF
jgi:hypothetical protein